MTRVNSQARFPLDEINEKALVCYVKLTFSTHINYGGWALAAVGKVLKINGYV